MISGADTLIEIVQTIDFGGWKLIGIVRTINFRGRPLNKLLEKCHGPVPIGCLLIRHPPLDQYYSKKHNTASVPCKWLGVQGTSPSCGIVPVIYLPNQLYSIVCSSCQFSKNRSLQKSIVRTILFRNQLSGQFQLMDGLRKQLSQQLQFMCTPEINFSGNSN